MKLRSIKLYLGMALVGLAASSCSDEESVFSSGDKVALTIEAGVANSITKSTSTRAQDATWSANDAIGITMLSLDGSQVINNAFNYIYNTPTGSNSFVPSSPDNTAYFPQDGSSVMIQSYYPYYNGLGSDMSIPVSVVDQTALPKIDLMSAKNSTGFSKNDAIVHLDFHHRLSKLIFNLQMEDGSQDITLDQFELTIKGMNTTGNYDLKAEALTVDDSSIKNVIMPYRGNPAGRYGIVLPRPAGEGVTFEFKAPDGSVYTALMSDDLLLEAGYKYTFNVTLRKTPITVSATIEDWIEGPTSYYDALDVSTPAGDSQGVKLGDIMNVYLKGDADYSFLKEFIYGSDAKWHTDAPLYWESITADPAELRASIIAAPALNTTQLADILIADDLSVPHNTGANFTFRHATSKVFVRLVSSNFSAQDLLGATITLPNYGMGGKEENGQFIPGTQQGDIQVDRSDPANAVALFQPQTLTPGAGIVKIMLNGRTYTATETSDFVFNPGEAKILTITLNKESVSISAEVVDWLLDSKDLTAITIGTPTSGGVGILDGEEMAVYTGNTATRALLTTFTYGLGANTWTPASAVYWEGLPDPTTFYGSIKRMDKYNNTQLDDYLVAKPVDVAASNGVALTLSHAASKVTVQLSSSDNSFSPTELAALNITLPAYANGAVVDNGLFVPGTGSGDITIAKNVGTGGNSAIALIQPQTMAQGRVVAKIVDPASSRTYTVTYTEAIEYKAGVATLLKIDMKKTAITLSATAIDWEMGSTIDLTPVAIGVIGMLGNTSDYFKNKTIHIYKYGANFESLTYSYLPGRTGFSWVGKPIYWDDQASQTLNTTAVFYPYEPLIPNITSNILAFPWNLPASQTNGYDNYDLLTSHVSLPRPSYLNYNFTHILSKVRVEVTSHEFSAAELAGMKVTLNDFLITGNVNMANGAVYGYGDATDLVPYTDTDGSKYSALVMPQTISKNTPVITLTLAGYPNTPFTGELTDNLIFVPGKENLITVNLKRTAIELSATLEPWTSGQTGEVVIE